MTIAICPKCGKYISADKDIPIGNCFAWENLDVFALYYGVCQCKGQILFCFECLEAEDLKCPNCGEVLEIQGPSAIPYELYKTRRETVRKVVLEMCKKIYNGMPKQHKEILKEIETIMQLIKKKKSNGPEIK